MKTKKVNCPRCDYSKAYFAKDFADGEGKPKTDLVCADCGFNFTIADRKRIDLETNDNPFGNPDGI